MTKVKPKVIFKTFFWLIIPLSFWFIYRRSLLWLPESDALTNPFYELRIFYLNLGALVGVLLLWFFHLKKWLLFTLCLIALLGLTARGPLLFALLLIVLSTGRKLFSNLKNFKLNKKKIAFVGSSGLVLISILFYYSSSIYLVIYETLVFRLGGLFTSFDGSIMGRFDRLGFAIENIFDSFFSFLFGHGIGSFGLMYNDKEIIDYPHNLFVESWFELGIIGLILSLIIFISPFFIKGKHIFKIMALFFLLQGMKSYSLVSIWPLFGFFGILLLNTQSSVQSNNYSRELSK
nr:O-antigen ligase family protein [uncultured Allomuricauda sp.]